MSAEVKKGYLTPYNSWKNRRAVLRFVQDIPAGPEDPAFSTAKDVNDKIDTLKHLPMTICWGMKDFVFNDLYLQEWQRRFPDAEVHTFDDAGHYVLEDAADEIVPLVKQFLDKHPLN